MTIPRELGEPLLVALAQGLGLSHAPNTVADYVYKLRKLFAFLRARGIEDAGRASAADLQAFREHLAETPTEHGPPTPGHLNNALKAVKAMYRWLCDSDVIAHDPARRLRFVREPRRLPRTIELRRAARGRISRKYSPSHLHASCDSGTRRSRSPLPWRTLTTPPSRSTS